MYKLLRHFLLYLLLLVVVVVVVVVMSKLAPSSMLAPSDSKDMLACVMFVSCDSYG